MTPSTQILDSTPYFPTFAQQGGKDRDTYAQVAQKALDLFSKNYTDTYVNAAPGKKTVNFYTKAKELTSVTQKWKERHDSIVRGQATGNTSIEVLRQERDNKALQCVAFRHIREETSRILTVFDNAIATLTLPKDLDGYTVGVLIQLQYGEESMKSRVRNIFTKKRNELIAKRTELQKFHIKVSSDYALLKLAFEPLAKHCAPTDSRVKESVKWLKTQLGSTPYADGLIHPHFKAMAEEKSQQKGEEKKSQDTNTVEKKA